MVGLGLLIAFAVIGSIGEPPPIQPPCAQEENCAAEKTNSDIDPRSVDERIADYTLWLERFTGLLAFVALIQIYLLWRADKTASVSANAALKSAMVAEKSLQTTARAFVYIDGFMNQITLLSDSNFSGEGQTRTGLPPELVITRFAVFPIWRNSGTSPTVNMTIKVGWCGPGTQIKIGDFDDDAERPLFIGPQSTTMSDPVIMTGITAIIEHSMNPIGPAPQLLIWGRADYKDVFGKAHWSQWCFRAIPSRPVSSQRLEVHFIQANEYNQTDNDAD